MNDAGGEFFFLRSGVQVLSVRSQVKQTIKEIFAQMESVGIQSMLSHMGESQDTGKIYDTPHGIKKTFFAFFPHHMF